ncbi:progranulin [Pimephales promelas]|nr:progranulin [Pimephales promelas]
MTSSSWRSLRRLSYLRSKSFVIPAPFGSLRGDKMLKLTVGFALVTLVACLQCPNNEVCEAGHLCCQDPTGEFSCCPFHHGDCCEDHMHCCPEGMLCSVLDFTCINATHTLPMAERRPAKQTDFPKSFRMIPSLPASEDDITCPDGSFCPAEFSCLLMASSYGCCPVAQGHVCSDGKHCCSKDHECSADSSSCVKQKEQVETVLCGDGKLECPVDTTCCEAEDGQCACCPLPRAVCCDDKIHCCPEDSVCDVEGSKCISSTNQELPMWAKFPARLRAEWEDHKPAEIRAEPKVTTITQNTTAENPMTTLPGALPENSDVPCNGTASCPDGTTCCKTKDGEWACCPLPEAVCCDDFIHCCPHGKTCNVAAGSCDDPSGSSPWLEKVPVQPISQNVPVTQDVPCNGTASCPDGTTCCKTKDGGWACCPLPEAVCCDDFIHCCPHGKTCNVAAGSCDDPSGSSPWLEKVPTHPRVAGQRSTENVNCDSSHICPESNTCCKNVDGDWACCPLPEAVCCWDRFHCCPHGTTCDIITLTCNSNTTSVPMSDIISDSDKEEPRQQEEVKEEVGKYIRVPCDAHTSCPEHTTCCLIVKTNKWGCCPLPNAVCCTDGEHCCPAHYKCDVSSVSCIKGDVVIPWYNKIASQSSSPNSDLGTNKCDEQSSCPADSTCCHLTTGEWGCCPLPEAVCCQDQEHCCPKGYKCDLRKRSCIKITWLFVDRVPLAQIGVQNPQLSVSEMEIQCGDGYSCQAGQTCCPTSQTSWACCLYSMAECCDDMKHCCPAGYKCGTGGICTPAIGFDWNNWDNWRVFFSKKKQASTL